MSRFGTEADGVVEGDTTGAPAEESARTMSLMGGIVSGEGQDDFSEADASGSGGGGTGILGQTTVLLLIVALIAAGAIYAMRMTNSDMTKGNVDQAVEDKIEQVLAKITAPDAKPADHPLGKEALQSLFRDTDAIVALFAEDPTQQQVPIEYVKKNPFTIALPKKEGETEVVQVVDRTAEMLKRKLESEVKSLKLQTVMQGRNPIAIINGQLVQVGQEVGSFTVTRIDELRVELSAADLTFTLEMERPNDDSRSRR